MEKRCRKAALFLVLLARGFFKMIMIYYDEQPGGDHKRS
jgi:hypothetical protein